MEHKNLDKLIINSKPTNDLEIYNKYFYKYKAELNLYKTPIFLISVLLFVFAILYFISALTMPYFKSFWIIIIIFVILVCILFNIIYKYTKLNNQLKHITFNNSPLLCYKIDLVNIYKKKQEYDRGWYLRYFLILDNEIELEINNEQYESLIEQHMKKVKIYFFEDLLKSNTRFEIDY